MKIDIERMSGDVILNDILLFKYSSLAITSKYYILEFKDLQNLIFKASRFDNAQWNTSPWRLNVLEISQSEVNTRPRYPHQR